MVSSKNLLTALLLIASPGTIKAQTKNNNLKNHITMTAEQIKQQSVGNWESITTEVRPSKNLDGTIKPLYLSRKFSYAPDGLFELFVTTFADPDGKIPLAKMDIKGHTEWVGEHPIATGAQKANFLADVEYTVTPLAQGFADVLNRFTAGYSEWKVGQTQSILKKAFAPFGLADGQIFKEYDLIYLNSSLMFWGARNVDGRGFDTEENRPTNLQVPMIRQK